MPSKEYHFYTPNDLALDEDFQNWVFHPDVKNNYFWETWQRDHPEKEEAIKKAIALVRSVEFRSYTLSNDEKEQLWDSIWDKMDHEETGDAPVPSNKKISGWRNWWKYAVAAAVVVFIAFGISLKLKTDPPKTISFSAQTNFGEVKTIILPDSSEVVLNANSSLVYSDNNADERAVWLDGEGFFHVKHTADDKKFIVHTYDNVSVEVLGTRFNVNSRDEKVAVVLQKGSVKLDVKEENSDHHAQLFLKPGEMFSYNKEDGNYSKSHVDVSLYDSWVSGKLIMNNYSLEDAAAFLQKVFGEKLIIKNKGLINNNISGSMPIIYNIDTMLVQFGKAFQVHFHRSQNEIYVEQKK